MRKGFVGAALALVMMVGALAPTMASTNSASVATDQVAYWVDTTGYAAVSQYDMDTTVQAEKVYDTFADASYWETSVDGYTSIAEGPAKAPILRKADADSFYIITGTTDDIDTVLLIARTGKTIWIGVYTGTVLADDGMTYFEQAVNARSLDIDAPAGWVVDTDI